MGGYMGVTSDGDPIRPLTYSDLQLLDQDKSRRLILRSIHDRDISDKSKSDPLGKSIALLQTVWFAVQAIARIFQKLPLTAIEVTTLAFVALNFLTYFFWWHKPVDVDYPIRIHFDRKELAQESDNNTFKLNQEAPAPTTSSLNTLLRSILCPDHIMGPVIPDRHPLDLDWTLRHKRVPTFYGGPWGHSIITDPRSHSLTPAAVSMTSVAVLFGSIHAGVGWHLHAPTMIELHIWRISSIIIFTVPFLLVVDCALVRFILELSITRWVMRMINVQNVQFLFFSLYILSRLVLIVLAFTLLRDLPKAAFQEVLWAKYIPHV
jgi:hypothetical protein